jgi:hypothetical protein
MAGRDRPSFTVAINRAMRVWVQGLGVGIPLVSMITVLLAYTGLRALNATSWDEAGGTQVLHRPLGPWRIVLIIAVQVVVFLLFVTFEA